MIGPKYEPVPEFVDWIVHFSQRCVYVNFCSEGTLTNNIIASINLKKLEV